MEGLHTELLDQLPRTVRREVAIAILPYIEGIFGEPVQVRVSDRKGRAWDFELDENRRFKEVDVTLLCVSV
jgi:hypothetical protein